MTVDTQSSALLPAWGDIATGLGYKLIDPLDDQEEGFLPTLKVSQNGERVSTFTAYVKRHEGSDSRLTVLKYSEVDQILIKNDENNEPYAYGVAYSRHGIPQIAHASKEVIVSAGALASPVILMKSGIGPADQLESANIPVVVNLPVGQNLREHTAVVLSFTAQDVDRNLMPRVEEDEFEEELKNYQAKPFRSGFFATLGGGPHAFIVSKVAKDERNEAGWPDLQITFEMMPYGLVVHEEEEDCPKCQKFNLYVALNRLESVGQLKLKADLYKNGIRSTTELAETDYNLFTVERDFRALIEGIQLAYKIATGTDTFGSMNVSYTDITPACESIDFATDEYWKCFIEQKAMIWNHITGTCTMGDEENGVVDSQLKVRGVGNLRVADASVLPTPTGVNINAAVMLVAEKTADQIFKDYGKRETVEDRNGSAGVGPMMMISVVTVVVAYFVR